MDQNNHEVEVQHGNGSLGVVCTLSKINPNTWPEERLLWLWEQLKSQDYAFDDISSLLGHQAFLVPLFNKDSEWYEIGNSGIAAMISIIPRVSAIFHYAVWDEVDHKTLFKLQHQLFDDTFTRWDLNRITAFIPSINKQAIRMATWAGFKYEGELRKAFLKNKQYYNLMVYGMLKSEFYKREVRN